MTANPSAPSTAPHPQTQTTAYISFSAEINPFTAESLIALCSQIANQGFKQVYLMLSTPGGEVMCGLNLYNVLRAMPFELTIHNVGNVDSIGNVVFLAGKTRYTCTHATFMFHGVGLDVQGRARFEEKTMKEAYDHLLADQKRIGSIIAQHTKLSENDISGFFREGQTKDAAFAVGCGIVHDVRDVKIPDGSPIHSLVFKR